MHKGREARGERRSAARIHAGGPRAQPVCCQGVPTPPQCRRCLAPASRQPVANPPNPAHRHCGLISAIMRISWRPRLHGSEAERREIKVAGGNLTPRQEKFQLKLEGRERRKQARARATWEEGGGGAGGGRYPNTHPPTYILYIGASGCTPGTLRARMR